MSRSILSAMVVFALWLVGADQARGAPILHTITFSVDSISGTPFGLTSQPPPITSQFIVDDSIFDSGMPEVIDALPGFSLIESIVIGDAMFTNADVQVVPGGRVVGGNRMPQQNDDTQESGSEDPRSTLASAAPLLRKSPG